MTGFINIPCWGYDSLDVGTFRHDAESSQEGGFVIRSRSADNLDAVSFRTGMSAGTYVVKVICMRGPDYGYLYLDLDGVNINELDGYNASELYNVILVKDNLVVAESGLKVITLRVAGKDASSSGYKMAVSSILLWRTS